MERYVPLINKQKPTLTKRRILILSLIAIGLFFAWTSFLWKVFSCGFAGSYTCAESWDLKIKESDLIQIIHDIKREHPDLEVPDTSIHKDLKESYWYHISFYYSDTKEIVETVMRPDVDSSVTTFSFVSLNYYKVIPKTKSDSLLTTLDINNSQTMDSLLGKLESDSKTIDYGFDYKEINRNFSYFANKGAIRKFENNILSLIRQKIRQRQKSGT